MANQRESSTGTWAERLQRLVSGQQPTPSHSSRRSFLTRSAFTLAAVPAVVGTLSVGSIGSAEEREGESELAETFHSIRNHENIHVKTLLSVLGSDARKKPTFQHLEQHSFKDFILVSQALENTGAGAYLGAAPAILSRDYLAAAGSIAFIEARHASFLNNQLDDPITAGVKDLDEDRAFETPLTAAEVVHGAGPFIKSLNGGPPVSYSTTPSDANDLAILNFALALEFLEADFYNINVPKFFGRK